MARRTNRDTFFFLKGNKLPKVDFSGLRKILDNLKKTQDDHIQAIIFSLELNIEEYEKLTEFVNQSVDGFKEIPMELFSDLVSVFKERRFILETISKDLIQLKKALPEAGGWEFDNLDEEADINTEEEFKIN